MEGSRVGAWYGTVNRRTGEWGGENIVEWNRVGQDRVW